MRLLIVCLLAAVPLGCYGSRWGWFTRDAERLCRMALAAQKMGEEERAEALWTKATQLRPDWFVPHYALTGEPFDTFPGTSNSLTLLDRLENLRWLKPLVTRLRRRQQQWREKEWERRLRLREQARQRACALVPDPDNLWAIWERDPHTAALYDEGYRLWRLQRYGEMADKVEQGLNRFPAYVRGYAMLLQASARVNQWERGLKRLTDVPPEVWTDLFDALSEDGWLVQRLRERRPAEWRMTFTNFYLTGKGWGAQLPSAEEAAHLEDAVLAARGGTVWVSMDQDHGQVWRFRRGQWRMYMALPPLDIVVTSDGQAYLLGDGHTNRFPLQVFEGGRFVPLFSWNEGDEYRAVVEWRGEVWTDGDAGVFRRAKGKWLLYQWGGDVVSVPPRKNPDGSRHWTRVMRDSGLPKLDYDSPEWGVLCVDSKGRLWYGKRLFDGRRFALPDVQLRQWHQRCWMDSAYRLWGLEEGFWGKSKWSLSWKSSAEYDPYYHRPPPKLADARGRLWHGTKGAGLALWDGRRLTFYTRQDGLSGDIVRSLAIDGETLWIGTDKGVSRARSPR